MNTTLRELIVNRAKKSPHKSDQGNILEQVSLYYLRNDNLQKKHYLTVWRYQDWVKEKPEFNYSKNDCGIDLVAELADHTYCAIQCKNYECNEKIYKADIDSFLAQTNHPFKSRILIDTAHALSDNLETQLVNFRKEKNFIRLTPEDMNDSNIDWIAFFNNEKKDKAKKKLRPDQVEVVKTVCDKFKTVDRGQLLMACGTGKTFTSLKIAEKIAGQGGIVLFMVPSLALLSQSLFDWACEADLVHPLAVCSDKSVGTQKNDDAQHISSTPYPVTTKPEKLVKHYQEITDKSKKIVVIFSTYHSIGVIEEAQKKYSLPEFDLIICDEAHRTTGVLLDSGDNSHFVKIHKNKYVQGKKRLYMTATARIYDEKAKNQDLILASMDDKDIYGEVLFRRDFSWAVENDLLTDYRIVVLGVDEQYISHAVQDSLSNENNELQLSDVCRIIGCYKALSKQGFTNDKTPIKTAITFCRDIKNSKKFANNFQNLIDDYLHNSKEDLNLTCEVNHVDGTMSGAQRAFELDKLKKTKSNECRILSNARCLSEGIDVPNLDAVIFLHPKKSHIDVVQAVGRVMRKAPNKKLGYIIIPIAIHSKVEVETALDKNQEYSVIWQVVNAIRAHDERLDANINRAGIGGDISDIMQITLDNPPAIAEAAYTQDFGIGKEEQVAQDITQNLKAQLDFNQIQQAIISRIVKKCGTHEYWEDWAKDVGKIAHNCIVRIKTELENQHSQAKNAFDDFVQEIHDDINDSITESDVIEMLAQHLITQPIFAILASEKFVKKNSIAKTLNNVLTAFKDIHLEKESQSLQNFYASVKRRAQGIKTSQERTNLLIKLYSEFFQYAFPRQAEKLGIVYTPVEIVDFIIRTVNDLLQQEFGKQLGSHNVHILDPFTGTGTFITRLLTSGLIETKNLKYKYENEIHANEIILLAYYIATLNIEAVYHDLQNIDFTDQTYTPFPNICLTDTFNLNEKQDQHATLLQDNSARRIRQKNLDIEVIFGNPPYSAGQRNENDNNKNVKYPLLDEKIKEKYASQSKAVLSRALYDSYIRAIRWGSDRLEKKGILAYITNGGWLESRSTDAMRASLASEYSSIYVLHLRGNQRTKGELSRKEGGKIFGTGSRAPIAITFFVKNPKTTKHQIFFHDIGDYLKRDEKLGRVKDFTLKNIKWQIITPDQYNDWFNQRIFFPDNYLKLGEKTSKNKQKIDNKLCIFENYSLGVATNRDAWVINSSKQQLIEQIEQMIAVYHDDLARISKHDPAYIKKNIDKLVTTDQTKIKWSGLLKKECCKLTKIENCDWEVRTTLYRPFFKQYLIYSKKLNERRYQMPKIFPTKDTDNLVIVTSGLGAGEFSALMTDCIAELGILDKSQCYPLYLQDNTTTPPHIHTHR